MEHEREILIAAYRDFNARRIDAVLAHMHPDVVWPNGMEGGYVYGQESIRDYWTRQWQIIDPHVEPVAIRMDETGRYDVEVHQVIQDTNGKLLADQTVHHIYSFQGGRIKRMDIEQAEKSSSSIS